jgi:hypothetical protein
MALNLTNLDEVTRKYMLKEVLQDILHDALYIGDRLTQEGREAYPQLLIEAVTNNDDDWLANSLRAGGYIAVSELRRKPTGGYTSVKVPVTAAATLAEGEFNRFYMRGLCLRAIEAGIDAVVVYRAKEVQQARPESEAMLNTTVSAKYLLEDLTANTGTFTTLPPGPNSGLSVCLP